MAKPCVFCGSTKNPTKEHLWPDWMRQLIPGKRRAHPAVEHRFESKGKVLRKYTAIPFTLEVGGFCKTCNNIWMNDIETEAKPTLIPLITSAKKYTIPADKMKDLANWIILKSMVFQLTQEYQPIPKNQYRQFCLQQAPYSTQRVWLTTRADRQPESLWGLHGVILGASKDDPERRNAYMSTFVLGNLVMEMFGHDLPFTFEFRRGDPYGPAFKDVWPVAGPIQWPPKYFIRSVNEFAKNVAIDDALSVILAANGVTVLKADA